MRGLFDAVVPGLGGGRGDRALKLGLTDLGLALVFDLLDVAVGGYVARDAAAERGPLLGRHRGGVRVLRHLEVDETVEQPLALGRGRHLHALAAHRAEAEREGDRGETCSRGHPHAPDSGRLGRHDLRHEPRHEPRHKPKISDAERAGAEQVRELGPLLGPEQGVDAPEGAGHGGLHPFVAPDALFGRRLGLGLVE